VAEQSKGDVYRSYAMMCFQLAQRTAEEERARWIEMAQHWVEWAEKADDDAKPADR
jgi:hypothetical protein